MLRIIKMTVALLAASPLFGQAVRLTGAIDNSASVVLTGHLNPHIATATSAGPVPAATWIGGVTLMFRPSADQEAQLVSFTARVHDHSSAEYRQWLGPESFADRFGLNQADISRIVAWLESGGFTIEQVARSRSWISFGGRAESFSRAFRTRFQYYELNGHRHFAAANDPSVPAALAPIVLGFTGLSDLYLQPVSSSANFHLSVSGPQASTSPELDGPLTPANMRTIYDINPLYGQGIDGSFQSIAVIGAVDPVQSSLLQDFAAFRSAYQLSSMVPAVGGGTRAALITQAADSSSPATSGPDLSEADLDVEWTGAVAKNAQIVFVYSASVFNAVRYAIDNRVAPVISMSFGSCESDLPDVDPVAMRSLAQQAEAEGITWFAASGDSGAAACDSHRLAPAAANGLAVLFPASIPEVTAVGGTEFAENLASDTTSLWDGAQNARGYIPEQAWNDTAFESILLSTGGGTSKIYTVKPTWQVGLGDTARDVPDIAFAASGLHDAYQVYMTDATVSSIPRRFDAGGTSAATPVAAGVLTLLNHRLSPAGASAGLGNINPGLYSLAAAQPAAFHDVITGNNQVPCVSNSPGCPTAATATKVIGFPATPGYDQTTGLGSLDVATFVNAWVSATPSSLTLTAAPASFSADDSVQLTAVVAGNSATLPTGSITFIVPATAVANAIVLAGPLPLSTASGMSMVSVPVSGYQFPGSGGALGMAYTVEAVYSGDFTFAGAGGTATVTVNTSSSRASVFASAVSPADDSPATSEAFNWSTRITLTNTSAIRATITSFRVQIGSGTAQDLSSLIPEYFHTSTITNAAPVQATWGTNGIAAPAQVEFTFSGTDAAGMPWTASTTSFFNGPLAPDTFVNSFVNAASLAPVLFPVPPIPSPLPDEVTSSPKVFSPGMLMTVFGGGFASFTSTAPLPLPTQLVGGAGMGSVSAQINGISAPLAFVSPQQINLQVPWELQSGFTSAAPAVPASLTLNVAGSVSTYSLMLAPVAPGIFPQAILSLNENDQLIGVNSLATPTEAGSMMAVCFTGAGALASSIPDGEAATALTPAPLARAMLALTGTNIQPMVFSNATTPATVAVTMVPGLVGVAQAIFRLPPNLAAGPYTIQLELQGFVPSGTTTTMLSQVVYSNSVNINVSACTSNCGN